MTTAKKTTTRSRKTTATRKRSTTATKKPRTVTVKKKTLPTNHMVYEILEAVDSDKVKAKMFDIGRTHGDDSFKMVMIWNVDESVISVLPEGSVP